MLVPPHYRLENCELGLLLLELALKAIITTLAPRITLLSTHVPSNTVWDSEGL